jgi:hypothetical protein
MHCCPTRLALVGDLQSTYPGSALQGCCTAFPPGRYDDAHACHYPLLHMPEAHFPMVWVKASGARCMTSQRIPHTASTSLARLAHSHAERGAHVCIDADATYRAISCFRCSCTADLRLGRDSSCRGLGGTTACVIARERTAALISAPFSFTPLCHLLRAQEKQRVGILRGGTGRATDILL